MTEKKKRILIAEDEKPMRTALELKLNSSGYDAVGVENGKEALALLKKEKFDLMLLDLIMPTMNGFELLQELKNEKITVPVIVSSNLSQDEDRSRATEYGAVDFFIKSDTSISEVIEHVKRALK